MQLFHAEVAGAGHLEQSLMDSLRTYAAPFEDDADGGQAADPLTMLAQDAAERHAALTEQAQQLLHQDAPSATDIRMYNMMLMRESTVQVETFPVFLL